MSGDEPQAGWGLGNRSVGASTVLVLFVFAAGCSAPVYGEPGGPAEAPDAGGAPTESSESGDSERGGSDAGTPDGSAGDESSNDDREKTHAGFEIPDIGAQEERGALRIRLSSTSEQLRSRFREVRREAERLRGLAESYDEQVRNPAIPEDGAQVLRRESARERARSEIWRALGAALVAGDARVLGVRTGLGREAAAGRAASTGIGQRAAQGAREAQKKALRELEEAKDERKRETNTEIQKLIDERSELLNRIADISGEHNRRLGELAQRRESVDETFARRQERIETRLQELSETPRAKQDRERVDELFDEVRGYRRDAMDRYAETADRLKEAKSSRQAYRQQLRQAKERLREVEQRSERIASEKLRAQKLALARTTVELRRRQVEKANSEVSSQSELLELHGRRSDYYGSVVDRLLPRISEAKRSAYYSVWKDDNWRDVAAAYRESKRAVVRQTEKRLDQLEALPERVYSAELWGWMLGLVWRVLLLVGAIYALRVYGDRLVHRLISGMLQRRFFRNRAAGTIKFGEWLRALSWPILLFGLSHLLAVYVVSLLPELQILHWAAHLGFAYWIVLSTLTLFVFPRAYRERDRSTAPAPELGRLSGRAGREGEDVVDVVRLDLDQARKAVWTARRLLVFGSTAWFIPAVISEVFGYSVLWSVAVRIFRWGIAGIAYYELSVWRDEIASLFREFAGERAPGIADFVENQKDRVWGVLVIAFASVFVLLAELWQFGRRYFVDTELNRRVANFLFRKQIEMKQQERDETGEGASDEKREVPDEYRALFRDRPLYDEPYRLDRDAVFEQVTEPWEEWKGGFQQGSLAVTGEQGLGKTTLVNRFYERILDESEAPDPIYAGLTEKIVTTDAVISYLVDLFDLPEVPQQRDHLVEMLLEADRRVVIVDDCHNMFFRKIQGFEALAFFLDVVNLTDHHHFWLLTFNKFGWKYLQRVQERKHFFGYTVELPEWSPEALKMAVELRNEQVPYEVSFTDLVVTREQERENYYEVVKTANGYFRLLQEYAEGNPRVALDFWVRNLTPDEDGTLNVSLFRRPSLDELSGVTDNHLFALTAIVQHGALSPGEVAEVINAEPGFCEMALDYFAEVEVLRRSPGSGRYSLTPRFFRPVVDELTSSNFLWT